MAGGRAGGADQAFTNFGKVPLGEGRARTTEAPGPLRRTTPLITASRDCKSCYLWVVWVWVWGAGQECAGGGPRSPRSAAGHRPLGRPLRPRRTCCGCGAPAAAPARRSRVWPAPTGAVLPGGALSDVRDGFRGGRGGAPHRRLRRCRGPPRRRGLDCKLRCVMPQRMRVKPATPDA